MAQHGIQTILKEFDIHSQFEYSPLSAGLINDTYLVTNAENQQFILQKINEKVFKNSAVKRTKYEGLLRNINFLKD